MISAFLFWIIKDCLFLLGYLSGEETGLRRTTVGVIRKLQTMTDEDFDRLDLDPSGLCLKGR